MLVEIRLQFVLPPHGESHGYMSRRSIRNRFYVWFECPHLENIHLTFEPLNPTLLCHVLKGPHKPIFCILKNIMCI